MAYYTKEMGGTLLIVTQDQRSYEVSRTYHSSGLSITPDKGVPAASSTEESDFIKMYKLSNCWSV